MADGGPGKNIRSVVARLAAASYTGIDYWLSLPVLELHKWYEPIKEAMKSDGQ